MSSEILNKIAMPPLESTPGNTLIEDPNKEEKKRKEKGNVEIAN